MNDHASVTRDITSVEDARRLRAVSDTSPPSSQPDTPSFGRIATLDSLREHLQWAIELEHFTIPPYLCALYSLDAVRNPGATEVVASVFVEEMLHMTLAANLLNAVGGRPRLDAPDAAGLSWMLAARRPLVRGLAGPLQPRRARGVSKIEQAAPAGAQPRATTTRRSASSTRRSAADCASCARSWARLQFFAAIRRGRWPTRPSREAGASSRSTASATALAALEEIVEQGEGADPLQVWDGDHDSAHPEREQVSHHCRFRSLKLGRCFRSGDTPLSGPTGDPISIDREGARDPRAAIPGTLGPCAGQSHPHGAGGGSTTPTRALAPPRAGVQRQPAGAYSRHRLDVRAKGQGPRR